MEDYFSMQRRRSSSSWIEENNVVSICFVVQQKEGNFVYPVIYLKEPIADEKTQMVHMFFNPFDAKKFVKEFLGDCAIISVCKEAPTEILEQVKCE